MERLANSFYAIGGFLLLYLAGLYKVLSAPSVIIRFFGLYIMVGLPFSAFQKLMSSAGVVVASEWMLLPLGAAFLTSFLLPDEV